MVSRDKFLGDLAQRASYFLQTLPGYACSVADACYEAVQEDESPLVSPYLMAAVADRESQAGLALPESEKGYDGHGTGVFQIDDRYHKKYCESRSPLDVRNDAVYAYALLLQNLDILKDIKKAVAAYNCGPRRVKQAVAEGLDIDTYTTGGRYSQWVMARAKQFESK